MRNLNHIKIFEEYSGFSYANESESEAVFSLTQEDIQDLFTSIIDKGYKLNIEKMCVDASDNYNLVIPYYDGGKSFRSLLVKNNLRGAYKIHLNNNKEEDETYHYQYSSNEISEFIFLLSEISQISKRVEYVEWGFEGTNDKIPSVFVVCPLLLDNKGNKKSFLNNDYKSRLNNLIYDEVSVIRSKIINTWTKSFKDARINYDHDNNRFYFFFKSVSKAVLSLNKRKLEDICGWYKIKDIKVQNIEEFEKENPNIKIPDKTSFVVDVNFDYDSIVKKAKIEFKGNFI